ncbi:MAG: AAA family ATPase [Propionibacteriaceae bacterium]|nr:AAA family ATPase [Propionibacteriaceae bacterium]
MKITQLRLSGFQSFGPDPTTIELAELTYVLGPNGTGKTASLLALARMFSPIQAQRQVQPEDFYVPKGASAELGYRPAQLWLEVDIDFEECGDRETYNPSVPPFFSHMHLTEPDYPPRVRIRLTADLESDGYVSEKIEYVLETDENDEPTKSAGMSRAERAAIEVHYLPARRDPTNQLAFSANSLLGRILRAANWSKQETELESLMASITESMASNGAIKLLDEGIADSWKSLHRGDYFNDPAIVFGQDDMQSMLKQLTLQFSPAHGGGSIEYRRLSDGQQSLLYISLVVAWSTLARRVLSGTDKSLDVDKLRPPVHTIIAIEEPENSLSPHYLGRIIGLLRRSCAQGDVQAMVATHSPAVVRRAEPTDIRFLRLSKDRTTTVHRILLPGGVGEDAKYVREAVMAFPDLYFSRLVVLGEGDSEQIVLQRVMAARGIAEDDASVSVVPLGGRHVHHFWRLLDELSIPYITLLDLDCARYRGGWGRIKYACESINKLKHTFDGKKIDKIPEWNDNRGFPEYDPSKGALSSLEKRGVFFSYPIDLDIMMLLAFPEAYGVKSESPDDSCVNAVLGSGRANERLLGKEVFLVFNDYRRLFTYGSKPANHLKALSRLSDEELTKYLPSVLTRLVEAVSMKLESIPE